MNIKKMDMTVLYAEDDEDVRELLSTIISTRVTNLIVAKDGQEALELFHKHEKEIDVIVTDIEMPRMTGLELIREVKQELNYPYIIITTAFNDTDFLLDAIELRINKFLFKPIRAEQLFNILEEIDYTLSLRADNIKKTKLLAEYKNAIDSSAMVYITDIEGNITYVNDTFCALINIEKDNIIGKNIDTIKSPIEDQSEKIKSTIVSKEIYKGIIYNTTNDSDTIITESTVCPILNVDDSIKEIIYISSDITERVNKERELAKLQTKVRQEELKKATQIRDADILALNPYPSCIIDSNRVIIASNSQFVELFDYITMKDIRDDIEESRANIDSLFENIPNDIDDNFSNFIDDFIGDDDKSIVTQKDNSQKYIIETKELENKIIVSLCKSDG
jgi:PAS domain S-box-containing protein